MYLNTMYLNTAQLCTPHNVELHKYIVKAPEGTFLTLSEN